MIDDLIEAFGRYVRDDDTRRAIEERVVRPCVEYLNARLVWGLDVFRIFQLVVVLVVVQTLVALFLLVRELRRG